MFKSVFLKSVVLKLKSRRKKRTNRCEREKKNSCEFSLIKREIPGREILLVNEISSPPLLQVTGSMKSCGWHPSFKIKTIEAFRRPSVCERAFFHQETSPPEDNLSTDNLRVAFESETMHVRGWETEQKGRESRALPAPSCSNRTIYSRGSNVASAVSTSLLSAGCLAANLKKKRNNNKLDDRPSPPRGKESEKFVRCVTISKTLRI